MRSAKREYIVVVAVFAAAAVLLTLPLALNLKRLLPSDQSDTLLSAWIIAWDADRLRHGLRGLFDAPIFYPYRDTLVFSETLLGLGIPLAPVYWITGDPVLTYNLAFLLSFVVAAVGMYLLTRELTGSRAAAFAAGLYYAFGPFRMAQISHVQMMATGWIPIALWGLHRYFSTRRWRWLAVFAAAWILQTLSNMYVGYFIGVPIVVVVADGLWRARGERLRMLLQLTCAAALVLAALAPVGAAYYRARTGYHHVRNTEEAVANSADLRSYMVGKNTIGVWRWLPTAVDLDPERELFPGIFAAGFVALGIFAATRRGSATAFGQTGSATASTGAGSAKVSAGAGSAKASAGAGSAKASAGAGSAKALAERRHWITIYAIIAVAAMTLSFGPHIHVWGTLVSEHGPYGWLLGIVPGMDGMRVPARFAIVVMAALAVLFAFGVEWTLARVAAPFRPLVLAVSVAMVIADSWSVPIQTVRLPMKPSNEQMLDYQFMTLFHHRPIVNGYSGYVTPLVAVLSSVSAPLDEVERFPATVRMLRSLGIRFVVVHPGDYDAAAAASGAGARAIAAFRASGQIVSEAALLTATAFELQPWDGPRASDEPASPIDPRELTVTASESSDRVANLLDGDPDTRWFAGLGGQDGSSWLNIRLARATNVSRVELQIAERSLADYPRQLRIDSVDAAGHLRTLYDAVPYPELGAALVRDASYPTIVVPLPPNDTVTLWIRQTAPTRAAWSVHELRLWRR